MLGDFNVILLSSERVGKLRSDLSLREFSDWVHDLGLFDIPLHGIKFTWRRNDSRSKLDRGFCTNVWLLMYPDT